MSRIGGSADVRDDGDLVQRNSPCTACTSDGVQTMTTSGIPQTHTPRGVWQIPAIDPDDRFVGGVSAGLASELTVATKWVRLAFVVLFTAGGWGGLLYVVLWGAMSWAEYAGATAKHPPTVKGRVPQSRYIGFAMVVGGLFTGAIAIGGIEPQFSLSMGMMALGLIVVRRQVSSRTQNRRVGAVGYMQLLAGLGLAAIGSMWLVTQLFPTSGLTIPIAFIGVILVVVAGSSPLWWSVVQDLDAERQARARSEERADVAAHLHDSVLQTLTLIQQNDGDPSRMAALARRQERELRNWLDPNRASRVGASVKGQVDDMISDVEELYAVPVEVVVVGDCLVDNEIAAALAAGREAIVNAAKHSGADRIDLFVEVTDSELELFVRDTGKGFDPDVVPADRRGVSESIHGRMDRVGGSVVVTSAAGEGTEVEIHLPRTNETEQENR